MNEQTKRKKLQEEWIRQHTLTPQQVRELLKNKLDRAAQMRQSLEFFRVKPTNQ